MGLTIILAAMQAMTVTVPAGTVAETRRGETEYQSCRRIVNKGTLVLHMPDGSEIVNDARSACAIQVVTPPEGVVEVQQPETMVDIVVSYGEGRDKRIVASLSLPLRSSSNALAGGWRSDPRTGGIYLDGQTISVVVDGDMPAVRYTSGSMRGRFLKGASPESWSVDAPLVDDGMPRVSSARIRVDGRRRLVRLSAATSTRR